MELAELKKLYVIEIRNKPNINSEQTIKSYVSAVNKFYSENTRVYRMSKNQLKEYLSQIRNKYSNSYYNVIGSALKILYTDVMKQPLKMGWFHPVKTEKKYVDIITYNEFVDMMKSTDQIKHKLIIIILYSTGIRLSELLNIKLMDIKNDRIFIRTVKHGKNRYVQLHKLTKRYLKSYLRKWNPSEYLFEGQSKPRYSPSSVQSIIKLASNGRFYVHLFRHTYLTNVIEKVDVFAAKELAGHMSLKSTMHYNHIPKERLISMYNPLDVAM